MEKTKHSHCYNPYFQLISEEYIIGIKRSVLTFRHKLTGARLVYMPDQGRETVFMAAFKTPAANKMGIAHVLEHMVLCSSENYPLKDVFNVLAKGSLHTYLNAITYPDFTIYPLASRNETDFFNMVQVYLDCLFHPNFSIWPELFLQEGWRPDGKQGINGIAYNEMKALYAQPYRVIQKSAQCLYYPDAHRWDGAGDPEYMTQMNVQHVKTYYKKYYKPRHCIFYINGSADIGKAMDFIHQSLPAGKIERRSNMLYPPSQFKKRWPVNRIGYYKARLPMEPYYYALSWQTGARYTMDRDNEWKILEQIFQYSGLFGDASENPYTGFSAAYLSNLTHSSFHLVGQSDKPEGVETYAAFVLERIKELTQTGVDKGIKAKAVNQIALQLAVLEERYKPRGLVMGIQIVKALWQGIPLENVLDYPKQLVNLWQMAEGSNLEEKICRLLIHNPHKVGYELRPEPDQRRTLNMPKTSAKSLEQYQKFVQLKENPELVQRVPTIHFTKEFIAGPYIPQASREKEQGINWYWLDHQENSVYYMKFRFDLEHLPEPVLFDVALLLKWMVQSAFGSQAALLFGEIRGTVKAYMEPVKTDCGYINKMSIDAIIFEESLPVFFEWLGAIKESPLNRAQENHLEQFIKQEQRAQEIRNQKNIKKNLIEKTLSPLSPYAACWDMTAGYGYTGYLKNNSTTHIIQRLYNAAQILTGAKINQIAVSSPQSLDKRKEIKTWGGLLSSSSKSAIGERGHRIAQGAAAAYEDTDKIYSFSIAGGYCAMAGRITDPYRSYLPLIKPVIEHQYLWPELRNKMGVYEAGFQIREKGLFCFYSCMDPDINNSFSVFRAAGTYLAQLTILPSELNQLKLAAAKYMIKRQKPFEKINFILNNLKNQRDSEWRIIRKADATQLKRAGEALTVSLKQQHVFVER